MLLQSQKNDSPQKGFEKVQLSFFLSSCLIPFFERITGISFNPGNYLRQSEWKLAFSLLTSSVVGLRQIYLRRFPFPFCLGVRKVEGAKFTAQIIQRKRLKHFLRWWMEEGDSASNLCVRSRGWESTMFFFHFWTVEIDTCSCEEKENKLNVACLIEFC